MSVHGAMMATETRLNKFSLRFADSPRLEADYQRFLRESEYELAKLLTWFLLVVEWAAFIVDFFVMDKGQIGWSLAFGIRSAVRLTIILLAIVILFVWKLRVQSRAYMRQHCTLLMCGIVVTINITNQFRLFALLSIDDARGYATDTFLLLTLLTVAISAPTIGRLDFQSTTIICVAAVVSYVTFTAIACSGWPFKSAVHHMDLSVNVYYLLIAMAVVCLGAYLLEKQHRQSFLTLRRLQQDKTVLNGKSPSDLKQDIVRQDLERLRTVHHRCQTVSSSLRTLQGQLGLQEIVVGELGVCVASLEDTQEVLADMVRGMTATKPTREPVLANIRVDPSISLLSESTAESSPSECLDPVLLESIPESESGAIRSFLARSRRWGSDVRILSELSHGQHLLVLGLHLFDAHALVNRFHIPPHTLWRFLHKLQLSYRNVPFHSSLHAADVVGNLEYFLSSRRMASLSSLEVLSCLVAAMAHDVSHPGLTNSYLVESRSPEALHYNDCSVLEHMHCSTTFRILGDDRYNILKSLSNLEWREARRLIVSIILETDTSRHFDLISQFRSKVSANLIEPRSLEDRMMVMKMAVKCADVGYAAKNTPVYLWWSGQVAEEFFAQGDLERANNLPVTPYCDRHNFSWQKGAEAVLEYFVLPMYEIWTQYLDDSRVQADCIDQLVANRDHLRQITSRETHIPAGPGSVYSPSHLTSHHIPFG
eukprot:GILK01008334.1.p1 GENE.GILK01008334.1~~GILK01008334.1.p1  ORF type:complete len:709 (-),score=67.08 GILK01008334.1:433-2559(-)